MKKEEFLISYLKLIMNLSDQLHQLLLISPQPSLKILHIGNKKGLSLTFYREIINIYPKKLNLLLQKSKEKPSQRLKRLGDNLLLKEKRMKISNIS